MIENILQLTILCKNGIRTVEYPLGKATYFVDTLFTSISSLSPNLSSPVVQMIPKLDEL